MIQIQAGGGAVCREHEGSLQVLLIYRNGLWDLPKGKRERGETIEACAQREVEEETGIPLPLIEQFLTITYHEYERDNKLYRKETHWFKMKTDVMSFIPQLEEGIAKVEWVKIEEAIEKVGYKNLSRVLNTIK